MISSRFPARKDYFFTIVLLFAFSGCTADLNSLWGFDKQSPPVQATPAPTPAATPNANVPQKNIELLWQVPNEPVEVYHLYVLDTNGEEKRHYRILVGKLKKEDDPTYGPIYRYTLPDALRGDATTIRIRAENRFGLSEPSEPMVVDK